MLRTLNQLRNALEKFWFDHFEELVWGWAIYLFVSFVVVAVGLIAKHDAACRMGIEMVLVGIFAAMVVFMYGVGRGPGV
jgi:hypothetical protein